MFIFRRHARLFEEINKFLTLADKVLNNFSQTFNYFLDYGLDASFEAKMVEADRMESNADTLLHNIQKALYRKSLLPESRQIPACRRCFVSRTRNRQSGIHYIYLRPKTDAGDPEVWMWD